MKKWTLRTLVTVIVLLWLVIAFLPFFFMIVTSLKEQKEVFSGNVFSLPKRLYLGNYLEILTTGSLFRYFKNSVCIQSQNSRAQDNP